jgi:hypothetical protein
MSESRDISWILYIDREAREGTFYTINDGAIKPVYAAKCTLGANPGNKEMVGDHRTQEGVFRIETAAIGEFETLYGAAFLNLEDKPFEGLQVTGTGLEDRIAAIKDGRDSTNGAATFLNQDMRRITAGIISGGAAYGRVVIEAPSRPLYGERS